MKNLFTPPALGALFGLMLMVADRSEAESPTGAADLRIGLPASLFRDVPESLALALGSPLVDLVEAKTGLRGNIVPVGGAVELGQKLAEDRVQLGVFQGIELAWAREKYPELRPLVVISNRDQHFRAFLVTRRDSGVRGLGDLAAGKLAIPRYSHEHLYRFLERLCEQAGTGPERVKTSKADNAEDALDDVVDGRLGAALVEGLPLRAYERRKPGRSERLHVVAESIEFPQSAIVYRQGALPRGTIERVREALLTAREAPIGRQLMTLWRVEGFIAPPQGYAAELSAVLKEYPLQRHLAVKSQALPPVMAGQGQP